MEILYGERERESLWMRVIRSRLGGVLGPGAKWREFGERGCSYGMGAVGDRNEE